MHHKVQKRSMAMKIFKQLWLAVILTGVVAGNAWADRPHHYGGHHYYPRSSVTLGVYLGDPWIYSPYYYPYSVYSPRIYAPAPIVVTTPPTVYVEQPAVSLAAPTLEAGFWYYCADSQAYYPYVKQCAGAWQKVAPQPAQ
jgi:hypothetical protein